MTAAEADGCCSGCGGTGRSGDVETNGKCWDCRGTGHAHEVTEETDEIAALIREIDGRHDMGASALAEVLISRGVRLATRLGEEIAAEIEASPREGKYAPDWHAATRRAARIARGGRQPGKQRLPESPSPTGTRGNGERLGSAHRHVEQADG